jgi:hypothetical protein
LYIMCRLTGCPAALGWAIRCPRQLVVLIRKVWIYKVIQDACPTAEVTEELVLSSLDLVKNFRAVFTRKRLYDCRSYLVSTLSQKESERAWCLSRPSVQQRLERAANGDDPWGDDPESWEAVISDYERDRLDTYRKRFPREAVLLSQNPEEWPVFSKRGVLPTLMHRGGITFIDHEIFTCFDLWRAMGFPIAPDEVEACKAECQFSDGRPVPACRSRTSQVAQCGNSMHVNFIGGMNLLLVLQLPMLGNIRDKVPSGVKRMSTSPPRQSSSSSSSSSSTEWATLYNRARVGSCRSSRRPLKFFLATFGLSLIFCLSHSLDHLSMLIC